ncbi:DUF58 domain-containing protein [Cellulomonas marina]|uniref:Uncharacterized conserved protein, DUF58 family, contains vWF domain n=1 Tax=Cellulomonas marina TaxID=988821 RepID=A0A1I0VLJ2_9CELL|nr:DUF58 domain-containing protein [Cellulomonas marina]GIG27913.1 hypothetical protein Cma02nite_05130 [Cellulomonas marina]SFA76770.1 Uncharacterized conserved protein, DUF58 family, contains vWF domain [Cellulomonas marina]
MRLRPTVRGTVLALAGLALLWVGALLGSDDVVQLGTVAVLLVAASVVVTGLRDPGRGRHRLRVTRSTSPPTLTAGRPAQVRTALRAATADGARRLAGARLQEAADDELTGGLPLRVRAVRVPGGAGLSYTVRPTRRGVWALGPLTLTRGDVFGVVRVRREVGTETLLRVWPATVALPAPREVLPGAPEQTVLGALTPAPDDVSLREYREGDDLRRVHWRSSARLGELVVRTDERAGTRPATVLVDTPADPDALEWTLGLGASMALALLDAGHAVRFVPADPDGDPAETFVHVTGGADARAAVLDSTVELVPAASGAAAAAGVRRAARALGHASGEREVLLAVVGTEPVPADDPLLPLGAGADAYAVVRHEGSDTTRERAHDVAELLGRHGWHVALAAVGEHPARVWERLLVGVPA